MTHACNLIGVQPTLAAICHATLAYFFTLSFFSFSSLFFFILSLTMTFCLILKRDLL